MPSPPTRVIVDDRPLRKSLTGVGNYIAQLLTQMPVYQPDWSLNPFLFTHLLRRDWRPAHAASASVRAEKPRGISGRVPWAARAAMQAGYALIFRVKSRKYELYHEPNHIPMRSNLPTVTTIHDLSVLANPQWHPADRVKWYEREFHNGVRLTRHFIAASEFTKREMIARLGIAAERITVTYQAARADFTPRRATDNAAALAADLPERFFLFVGTLEPRKNVPGLLEAYAALPARVRARQPLLIAGAWGWKAEALRTLLSERDMSNDVRLLGYLHDPQLAELYRRCTAFVWPSWYEGFGLPPLEAMACGAPVAVSNVSSLPEVVGDAGVLLDPRETRAWTETLQRLAEDEAFRDERRAAGLQQASRFSWREFASRTATAYAAALRE